MPKYRIPNSEIIILFRNSCIISYDFTPVNKFKSTSLTCVLNDSVIIKCFRKLFKNYLKISLKPNLKTYFEKFLKSKNSGKIFDVKNEFNNLVGILFCNCGDTKLHS